MARDRWEEVIVDDDGDPIDIAPDVGARYIATELPDTVDDVYIAVSVILWDGPGGILGVAATRHSLSRSEFEVSVRSARAAKYPM